MSAQTRQSLSSSPLLRETAVLRRSARGGFTLLELLLVMAIVVAVMSTAAPAVRGTLDGVNLTGAEELVEGQLSLARQIAMSRNLPVEVRFYQDTSISSNPWRIVGMVIPAISTGQSKDEWVAAPAMLPGTVIVDTTAGKDFSTVLTNISADVPTSANPDPVGPWKSQESNSAPYRVRGKSYIAFRFQPNGSTNLPASADASSNQAWSISLKNLKDRSTNGVTPAANYIAVVIDPLTGRTLSYRP
ncbi:MAG: Verru_Chthon cassette protein D [Chthoniobacteraceae bacterium]